MSILRFLFIGAWGKNGEIIQALYLAAHRKNWYPLFSFFTPMAASYPTKLMLAMKSGNICARKECHVHLISEGKEADCALIGEAAHIYGENPSAARYREDMTDEERNHVDNLIYLCPNCHTIIDKQEKDFPVDYLFALKREHEDYVHNQLACGMINISFNELYTAAIAISGSNNSTPSNFQVITPNEKIKKNNLTDVSKFYITLGLSQSHEVETFLVKMAQISDGFPEKLKDGFKRKYDELAKVHSGDILFSKMVDFAQLDFSEFRQKAAGLAILCYLFQLCEIFEK